MNLGLYELDFLLIVLETKGWWSIAPAIPARGSPQAALPKPIPVLSTRGCPTTAASLPHGRQQNRGVEAPGPTFGWFAVVSCMEPEYSYSTIFQMDCSRPTVQLMDCGNLLISMIVIYHNSFDSCLLPIACVQAAGTISDPKHKTLQVNTIFY